MLEFQTHSCDSTFRHHSVNAKQSSHLNRNDRMFCCCCLFYFPKVKYESWMWTQLLFMCSDAEADTWKFKVVKQKKIINPGIFETHWELAVDEIGQRRKNNMDFEFYLIIFLTFEQWRLLSIRCINSFKASPSC